MHFALCSMWALIEAIQLAPKDQRALKLLEELIKSHKNELPEINDLLVTLNICRELVKQVNPVRNSSGALNPAGMTISSLFRLFTIPSNLLFLIIFGRVDLTRLGIGYSTKFWD